MLEQHVGDVTTWFQWGGFITVIIGATWKLSTSFSKLGNKITDVKDELVGKITDVKVEMTKVGATAEANGGMLESHGGKLDEIARENVECAVDRKDHDGRLKGIYSRVEALESQ